MIHKKDIIDKAILEYKKVNIKKIYINSAITEQGAYEIVRGRRISVRPRLLEIIKFSELMGWKKIGIAYCGGLRNEASRVVEILENAGLDIYSIVCSCGHFDKTDLGVHKKYKISNLDGNADKFEEACNPIVQAEILNSERLDLHIIIGLCIGHDILFTMYSKAPVSTLIVKDRVMGHASMISLYSAYHKRYWKEK